jgi:hypothetical protein
VYRYTLVTIPQPQQTTSPTENRDFFPLSKGVEKMETNPSSGHKPSRPCYRAAKKMNQKERIRKETKPMSSPHIADHHPFRIRRGLVHFSANQHPFAQQPLPENMDLSPSFPVNGYGELENRRSVDQLIAPARLSPQKQLPPPAQSQPGRGLRGDGNWKNKGLWTNSPPPHNERQPLAQTIRYCC